MLKAQRSISGGSNIAQVRAFWFNRIEVDTKEDLALRAGASPRESEEEELFWNGYLLKENGIQIGHVNMTTRDEGGEDTV